MTTDRIQCPVCQYAHIPRDMETCPQCDADLVCFRLLDRLSDNPPEPVPMVPESSPEKKSVIGDTSDNQDAAGLKPHDLSGIHSKRIPLALMGLTLVLAGFFIFFIYRLSAIDHLLQRQHTILMDLVTTGPFVDNDPQKTNRILELIRKQEISLTQNERFYTDMDLLKTCIRENSTRLRRIESRLSHLPPLDETGPIPDTMKQVPIGIKPVLILPESLK